MIKILKEGAGAGYTVEGKLMYDPKINKFSVSYRKDGILEVYCDIDAELTAGTEAYSYYNGGSIDEFIPVKITYLKLEPIYDDDVELDKYSLRDALDNIKFKTHIGSGWSHTTFNGDLSTDDIKDNHYTSFYVLEIQMYITDEDDIKYIDRLVTGDTSVYSFVALDSDYDIIDDSFDTLEDATEFAKNNPDVYYIEMYRNIERRNGDWDVADTELVWTRY